MNRERLIKWIEETNTKVYERGNIRVYAGVYTESIKRKKVVKIRVDDGDGVSGAVVVDIHNSNDPAKAMRDVISMGGLTLRDAEFIFEKLRKDIDKIKRMDDMGEYGIKEIIPEVNEILKERCITRSIAEQIDPTMDNSILLEKGKYRLKAKVLMRIAEELDVKYSLLRDELQNLRFLYKGVGKRDDGISLKGNKLRLLIIDKQLLDKVYGDAEEADQEDTASA